MDGEAMDAATVWFENAEWAVFADGLEHKRTGYFIGRDQVGRQRSDGAWEWPVHMLEKSWVETASFVAAFGSAVRLFGLAADGRLARSFQGGLDGFGPEDMVRPADVPAVPEPKLRAGTKELSDALRRASRPAAAPSRRRAA